MKKNLKFFGIYLPIFIVTTIVSVIFRTVAIFTQYNAVSGHFDMKGLITAADCMIIAICFFSLSFLATPSSKSKLIPDFTSPETYIPTGAVSVSLLFMLGFLLSNLREMLSGIDEYGASIIPTQTPNLYVIIILCALIILSALSIFHFFFTATDEKHSSTRRANFGLCTVIFLALYSSYLYLSSNLPLNAPNKVVDQMAYLAASIFFLYEIRISLGREKWGLYVSFGFIASALTAYSSIPSLIYYFVKSAVISNSLYETALTFSLFIFITSRLLLTGKLTRLSPSPTATQMISFANSRELELNAQKEIVEEPEAESSIPYEPQENQIQIEGLYENSEPNREETEN